MTIKRIHTCTLTPKEVVNYLQQGCVVEDTSNDTTYKMIDGVLCKFVHGILNSAGACIPVEDTCKYIDVEEPFKIDGPGMYKTRDGTKAFVSVVCKERITYPVFGIVQGNSGRSSWTLSGREIFDQESSDDIVEKL